MIPFYKIVVNENDDTGVDFNAFVDRPAHMKSFIAFGKDTVRYSFNEEKRIVTGVMISVGTPIYRRDAEFGEHYVIFDAPTVEMIRTKFFRHGFNQNLNADHDPNKVIKGATLIDSYIASNSDPKLPSIPEAFTSMNLMDGTWIASYKIEDDALWNDVKNGKFKGFSVEGWFDKVKININSKSSKMAEQTKKDTLWNTLKAMFSNEEEQEEQKFAQATTADGIVVMYDGELAQGALLTIQSEDGQSMPAPEGTHQLTLEDGTVKIVVLDGSGAVQSIEDFQAEDQTSTAEVTQLRAEVVELMTEFATIQNDRFAKIEAENTALKAELKTIKEGDKFKATPKGGAATEEEKPKKLTVAEILKNAKK